MHTPLIFSPTTFSELRCKQVINLCDGRSLGCVTDLELNALTGEITALILPGDGIFASLSQKNRIAVPWCNIERIGKDAILVRVEHHDRKDDK